MDFIIACRSAGIFVTTPSLVLSDSTILEIISIGPKILLESVDNISPEWLSDHLSWMTGLGNQIVSCKAILDWRAIYDGRLEAIRLEIEINKAATEEEKKRKREEKKAIELENKESKRRMKEESRKKELQEKELAKKPVRNVFGDIMNSRNRGAAGQPTTNSSYKAAPRASKSRGMTALPAKYQ